MYRTRTQEETDRIVGMIIPLKNAGLTNKQVARRLDMPVGTINGIVYREITCDGMPPVDKRTQRRRSLKKALEQPPGPAPKVCVAPVVPKPKKKLPMPVPEFIPIDDTETIPMMNLKDHQCKWPIGDYPFRFCGRPIQVGYPYCPKHVKDAHQPGALARLR